MSYTVEVIICYVLCCTLTQYYKYQCKIVFTLVYVSSLYYGVVGCKLLYLPRGYISK